MSDATLPQPSDMVELGREMLAASARNREQALGKADPAWLRNREVYDAQRSHADQGTMTEGFGLELADRDARNSWQAQMSDDDEPEGNFSAPFELLSESEIEGLEKAARSPRGRRRLRQLAYWLGALAQ